MSSESTNMTNFTILGILTYGIWELGVSIINEIGKYNKKKRFLEEIGDNECSIEQMRNMKDGDYVILKGTTEKIYQRNSELLDKSIILSLGTPNYYEDFFLNSSSGKVVLQPYSGSRFHALPFRYLTESKTTFEKIIKFLFFWKTPIVFENEQLFVFGKIVKNPNDIPSDLQNFLNIVPKEVTTTSLSDLKYYVPEKHSKNIFLKSIVLLGITTFTCLFIRDILFPELKKLFRSKSTYVKRNKDVCVKCETNPTTVLCKKCTNFTNFCSSCHNSNKSALDEIALTCDYCKVNPKDWIELKIEN